MDLFCRNCGFKYAFAITMCCVHFISCQTVSKSFASDGIKGQHSQEVDIKKDNYMYFDCVVNRGENKTVSSTNDTFFNKRNANDNISWTIFNSSRLSLNELLQKVSVHSIPWEEELWLSSLDNCLQKTILEVQLKTCRDPLCTVRNSTVRLTHCSCDRVTCVKYMTCCPDIIPAELFQNYSSLMLKNGYTNKLQCQPMELRHHRIYAYMVSSCDSDTSPFSNNCSRPYTASLETFDDILPTFDITSFTVYRNKYCAYCNGVTDTKLRFFRARLECSKSTAADRMTEKNVIQTVFTNNTCELVFRPNNLVELENTPICKRPAIKTCNVTGKWVIYDAAIDLACQMFDSVKRSIYTKNVYANVFCWFCNEDDTQMNTVCKEPSFENIVVPRLFRYVLDGLHMKTALTSGETEKPNLDYCKSRDVFDQYKSRNMNVTCPKPLPSFDDPLAVCHVVYLKLVPTQGRFHGDLGHGVSIEIDNIVARIKGKVIYAKYSIGLELLTKVSEDVVENSTTNMTDDAATDHNLMRNLADDGAKEYNLMVNMTGNDGMDDDLMANIANDVAMGHDLMANMTDGVALGNYWMANVTDGVSVDQDWKTNAFDGVAKDGDLLINSFEENRFWTQTHIDIRAEIAPTYNVSVIEFSKAILDLHGSDIVINDIPFIIKVTQSSELLSCPNTEPNKRAACTECLTSRGLLCTISLPDDHLSYGHLSFYDLFSYDTINVDVLMNCTYLTFATNDIYWEFKNEFVVLQDNYNLDTNEYYVYTSHNETFLCMCVDTYRLYISNTSRYLLDNPPNYKWILIIYDILLAALFLSVLALLFSLITFVTFPELRSSIPGKNTLILCALLLTTHIWYLIAYLKGVNSDVKVWCQTYGLLFQFLWLTTVFWMNVCTFHMFQTFRTMNSVSNQSHCKKISFYIFCAVGMSMVFVASNIIISYVLHDQYVYDPSTCLSSLPLLSLATFFAPISVATASNLIMFLIVVIKVRSSAVSARSMGKDRNYIVICVKLSTITGLTWFLYYLVFVSPYLGLIAEFFQCCQGLFIFFAFVCNRRVLALFQAKISSWSSTSTTLATDMSTSKNATLKGVTLTTEISSTKKSTSEQV